MLYRRCSIFCRVWLNSKTFTHAVFLTHANHATHAKISTHATHAKMLWTHVTHPKIWIHVTHVIHAKILWTILPTPTTLKFDPRTHAPILPTPPTRFSRLSLRQIGNFFIINNWQLVQKDLSHFPQSIFTEKVQKYLFHWSIFNLQLFHT